MTPLFANLVIWFVCSALLPINFDYLLLLLAYRLHALAYIGLGMLVAAAHVFLLLFYLDHHISAVDLAEMVVHDPYLTLAALGVVAGLVLMMLLDRHIVRRLPRRSIAIVFTVILGGMVCLYLAFKTGRLATQPVFSPLASLAKRVPDPEWWRWMMTHNLQRTMANPLPVPSLTYQAILSGSHAGHAGIVMMHVESWGLPRNELVMSTLVKGLQQSHPTHDFTLHTEPFRSFTLPNEVRVLCNLDIGSLRFKPSAQQASDCLPTQLQRRGWQTIAIHNSRGDFYQRNEWYPAIGFSRFDDRETLDRGKLTRCVLAYNSTCDREVVRWIDQLPLKTPYFLYWMSIDPHLPITARAQLAIADQTSPASKCPILEDGCAADVQWELVQQSVLGFFELLRSHPDTVLIAKGDHRPYFYTRERQRYSQDEVPVLIAMPRAAHDRLVPAAAGQP